MAWVVHVVAKEVSHRWGASCFGPRGKKYSLTLILDSVMKKNLNLQSGQTNSQWITGPSHTQKQWVQVVWQATQEYCCSNHLTPQLLIFIWLNRILKPTHHITPILPLAGPSYSFQTKPNFKACYLQQGTQALKPMTQSNEKMLGQPGKALCLSVWLAQEAATSISLQSLPNESSCQ